MSSDTNKKRATLERKKGSDLVGTGTFAGVRAADIWFQYALIRNGWATQLISRLGGQHVALANVANAGVGSGIGGLPPYYSVLTLMAAGSALKHIIWATVICDYEMPPAASVAIGALNTVYNSLNTIFSVWALTSNAPPASSTLLGSASISNRSWLDSFFGSTFTGISPSFYLGIALYTTGIVTELVAEFQRKNFKSKPENKGKPYSGGLWSLATNINYGAYTLWRAGYAMAAGGLPWGLLVGSAVFADFALRAVPEMDDYMKKYGADYENVKRKVRYRLLPLIY